MFKGSVFFRIPRTKENLDYLREMMQPIWSLTCRGGD
jgi:hypothetical protein